MPHAYTHTPKHTEIYTRNAAHQHLIRYAHALAALCVRIHATESTQFILIKNNNNVLRFGFRIRLFLGFFVLRLFAGKRPREAGDWRLGLFCDLSVPRHFTGPCTSNQKSTAHFNYCSQFTLSAIDWPTNYHWTQLNLKWCSAGRVLVRTPIRSGPFQGVHSRLRHICVCHTSDDLRPQWRSNSHNTCKQQRGAVAAFTFTGSLQCNATALALRHFLFTVLCAIFVFVLFVFLCDDPIRCFWQAKPCHLWPFWCSLYQPNITDSERLPITKLQLEVLFWRLAALLIFKHFAQVHSGLWMGTRPLAEICVSMLNLKGCCLWYPYLLRLITGFLFYIQTIIIDRAVRDSLGILESKFLTKKFNIAVSDFVVAKKNWVHYV